MTHTEIITKLCDFAAGLSDLQERSRQMAEDMQSFLKELQSEEN
jgi:hypothetical protein